MSDAYRRNLRHPEGKVDVILDTDAFNEIDDQFAISYLAHAEEKANIKAFYAAPFYNSHSTGPGDGMEKSYEEIMHVLRLQGRDDLCGRVLRGSEDYLKDEETPQDSPAARDLAERAMSYTAETPLYVLAIGAITNVASALIMKPEIAERIVIVWLGGHAHWWKDTNEFNMMQDVAAARVVFNAETALVQLPCGGVVEQLRTTKPELEYWLRNQNVISDYLARNTIQEAEHDSGFLTWSRTIWDISTVAWLLSDGTRFMDEEIVPAPLPEYDNTYSFDETRHPMLVVTHIDRDAIFADLFGRLTERKTRK
ncbi:MAG: nucleoside hydrolase [Lachnospiraceae bacterium]|nr:nucleoside hydrolase [Lachnospiraceae bacterium]